MCRYGLPAPVGCKHEMQWYAVESGPGSGGTAPWVARGRPSARHPSGGGASKQPMPAIAAAAVQQQSSGSCRRDDREWRVLTESGVPAAAGGTRWRCVAGSTCSGARNLPQAAARLDNAVKQQRGAREPTEHLGLHCLHGTTSHTPYTCRDCRQRPGRRQAARLLACPDVRCTTLRGAAPQTRPAQAPELHLVRLAVPSLSAPLSANL